MEAVTSRERRDPSYVGMTVGRGWLTDVRPELVEGPAVGWFDELTTNGISSATAPRETLPRTLLSVRVQS